MVFLERHFPVTMTDINNRTRTCFPLIKYACINHVKICFSKSLHFKQLCHLIAVHAHTDNMHISGLKLFEWRAVVAALAVELNSHLMKHPSVAAT